MTALSAFFTLGVTVCLWGFYDLLVYSALRAFFQRYDDWMRVLGCLSLAVLKLCLLGVILLAGSDWDWNWSWTREVSFFGVGGTFLFLVILGFGGFIMHHATQKKLSWWNGILFTALFYVVSQGSITYFSNLHPEISRAVSFSFDRSVEHLGINGYDDAVGGLTIFLLGIFPLGSPLFEIIIRSFQRVSEQNTTGAFS